MNIRGELARLAKRIKPRGRVVVLWQDLETGLFGPEDEASVGPYDQVVRVIYEDRPLGDHSTDEDDDVQV